MKRRVLGNTSLELSEIGFGCGKLGSTLSSCSADQASQTLTAAYDSGVTFYDTADMYGQGRSEEILGKTLGPKRHSIVIATKAGYESGKAVNLTGKLKPALWPLVKRLRRLGKSAQRAASRQRRQNFSPDYLMAALERSLNRLRTDYIDIFLLHSPDLTVIEEGGWIDALQRAKEQGKIRFYGVSCRVAEHATACMQIPGVACAQIPVNLIEREGIEPLLDQAAARSFGLLARQPLASGMLAKPLAALRFEDFSLSREEFDDHLARIRTLPGWSDTASTCLQAAFRYVLQLNQISSVILGMSGRDHLLDNLQAIAVAAPVLTRGGHS